MTSTLTRDDGICLAYAHTPGTGPTCVFLPGFKSDMMGSKALALEAHARAQGWAMLRLDYSGHGQSGGRFEDGTISRWRDDVLCLVDQIVQGPLLLIGSSMGGWLALLVALARPERVVALTLIAPAPDFTSWGMEASLTNADRAALARDGFFIQPSDYGPEGYHITAHLLEDGRQNRLMGGAIHLSCPVRLLHGQLDADVPWQLSLDLQDKVVSSNMQLTFVKDGDHRLSRPQDIALLTRIVDELHTGLQSTR
jgi:pimeloyl-ACP methyl ester carboxylesterase